MEMKVLRRPDLKLIDVPGNKSQFDRLMKSSMA